MPLFKGKAGKAKPKKAIDYITKKDKAVIISSLSMDDSRDYTVQFKETCDLYGKGGGYRERKYYHFKLSPDPADRPSPQQVHELAERLAYELFSAHECIIATHNDTDTIHSHIIVNAVSFETGRKLHLSIGKNGEYAQSKDLADKLGAEMGFTALDWREKVKERYERLDDGSAKERKEMSNAERQIAKRDIQGTESWKDALRQTIDEAKAVCTSRAEFQRYLQDNYGVTMPRSTARTVSFVHPAVGENYTVRSAKLGNDYTAASIDEALQLNKERSTINAGLFINETESITTTNPAGRANSADPAFISQPAVQDGSGERIAPGSLGAVGRELRSIDSAVERIAKPLQRELSGKSTVASEPNVENAVQPIQRLGNHQEDVGSEQKRPAIADSRPTESERIIHQKPKRRSHSYDR
jgi:hypothetical protein